MSRQSRDFTLANRERVNTLLEKAVQSPLVVLSAGSGFGKTQAVASYQAGAAQPVIWLRLMPLDSYPTRFWALFTGAVKEWSVALWEELAAMPFPDTLPALHQALECIARAGREKGKAVLVFDDIHYLQPGEVRDFIAALIGARLEHLSVLLISMEEVDMDFGADIRQTRLTDRHLRFTREEIRVYYTAHNILVEEKMLDAICKLTEGWAVAVYLLGLHLQKNQPLQQESVDNALAYVYQILENHIFGALDPESRHAVVLLSHLEEFTLEMACKLTGMRGEKLQSVFRQMTFVSYRSDTRSYCFHNLLLEFLRTKQAMMTAKTRKSLFRKAAQWYEGKGQIAETVRYYAACGACDDIVRVLDGADLFQLKGDVAARCVGTIQEMRGDFRRHCPWLWFYEGILQFVTGAVQRSQETLQALKRDLEARENSPDYSRLLGETCVQLAYMGRRSGSYEFVALLRAAADYLPEGSSLYRGKGISYLGSGSAMIFPEPIPGEMENMQGAIFQAAPYLKQLAGGFSEGSEYLAMAEAYFYRTHMEPAKECAGEAIVRAAGSGRWDTAGNACYLRMRIAMAQGELAAAEYELEQLRRYGRMTEGGGYFTLLDIAQSNFFIKMGLEEQVAGWIKEELPHQKTFYPQLGRELVMMAGYQVASRKYRQCLSFIDHAMGICRETGQTFSEIKLRILKAVVHGLLEQDGVAAKHLENAFRRTGPNGILMPYVEFGKNMLHLVERVGPVALRDRTIPQEWLEEITREATHYARNMDRVQGDYIRRENIRPSPLKALTAREWETLEFLCGKGGVAEAAHHTGDRVEAVEQRVGEICRKLSVRDLDEAVRRARELGMAGPPFPPQ